MSTGEPPVATLVRWANELKPPDSAQPTRAALVRLGGFSLYWTWIWALLITDVSGLQGIAASMLAPSVAELATRGGALLVIAIVARHLSAHSFTKRAAVLASILGPFGVALLGVGGTLGLSSIVITAAWVPIGVADALLIIGWLDLYRYDGLRSAVLSVCLASLVAVPLLVVIAALPELGATVVVIALPALSGLALRSANAANSPEVRRAMDTPSATPLRTLTSAGTLFAIITAYSLAFGTMQAFTYTDTSTSFPFGLRVLALSLGAVLSLVVSLSPNRSNTNTIFRVALPIFAFALLIAPVMGNSTALAGVLVIVGFRLFDVLSITILLRLSALHNLPPTATFSIGKLANTLGHLGGWIVTSALAGFVALDSTTLESASSALLFLLIVTSGALLGIEGKTGENTETPGADSTTAEAYEALTMGRWRRQCELVSTQYGLSPREKEVLELLAKGRDAAYISTLFVISPHTAKTHIHNVYKKLGIHSQQELIDLVEQAAADLKDPASTL